jgi:hypothetical protein
MTRICIQDGCKKCPNFGIKNGPSVYCNDHKKEKMENVRAMVCNFKDCNNQPSFNISGNKPLYCSLHKENSMTNVRKNICIENGCKKKSYYNLLGKSPIYCRVHKLENMINLDGKRCLEENCYKRPSFNFEGKKPIYCFDHKKNDMISTAKPPCEFADCQTRPVYGFKNCKPTRCTNHKLQTMVDLNSKFCTSCKLYVVVKKNNYLCYYCQPTPRMMKKETKVKTLLQENGLKFVHNKQINNDCCLLYKPDFLFDCNTYFVVLECDEDQHSSYDKDCEIIRMNNITMGLGLPTLFIRYNPDLPGFKVKQKHRKLLETLNKYLNMKVLEDPTPIYLFYKEKLINQSKET